MNEVLGDNFIIIFVLSSINSLSVSGFSFHLKLRWFLSCDTGDSLHKYININSEKLEHINDYDFVLTIDFCYIQSETSQVHFNTVYVLVIETITVTITVESVLRPGVRNDGLSVSHSVYTFSWAPCCWVVLGCMRSHERYRKFLLWAVHTPAKTCHAIYKAPRANALLP